MVTSPVRVRPALVVRETGQNEHVVFDVSERFEDIRQLEVEALGRRPKAIAPPTLKVHGLLLDTGSREVTRDGKRIELTPKEYAVLEYLMRHQGRVMSRTLITEYAWDYHFDPGTNIVDVVITRLRKKIDHGKEPKLIHTVRGVGYVVRA